MAEKNFDRIDLIGDFQLTPRKTSIENCQLIFLKRQEALNSFMAARPFLVVDDGVKCSEISCHMEADALTFRIFSMKLADPPLIDCRVSNEDLGIEVYERYMALRSDGGCEGSDTLYGTEQYMAAAAVAKLKGSGLHFRPETEHRAVEALAQLISYRFHIMEEARFERCGLQPVRRLAMKAAEI